MRYKKISIQKTLHELRCLKRNIAQLTESVKGCNRTETAFHEYGEQFAWLHPKTTLNRQVLDENGCLLAVNSVWLQTMGYTREEVIGCWFGNFLAPRDVSLFTKNLLCIGKTGEMSRIVVRMVCKDRSFIVVSFNGLIKLDNHGIFRQIHCSFEDITHLIRFNSELQYVDESFSVADKAAGL